MKGVWAIPIILSILIIGTLGLTPVQSNAENSACDKIKELVAAGKIPAEVGAKLLEKADCDTQVVKITAIDKFSREFVENASCELRNISEGLLDQGFTDANGNVVLTLPSTISVVDSIFCTKGSAPEFPIFAFQCNVAITDAFTEIILELQILNQPCDFL